MDTHSQKFKIRLGLFIAGGFALFILAIFIIGKQQNLFSPVFKLTTTFSNVSGLQVGNNVRFTGINVGTVDNIMIINDSTVRVEMLIKKEIQQFIKTDCVVAIGSEGLIGDRLLVISQGGTDSPLVTEGQELPSTEPLETDAILASLQVTSGHAEIITQQLAEVMVKVNSGSGTLGRLIHDSVIAQNISHTIENFRGTSSGLEETVETVRQDVSEIMGSLKVTTGNAEVFSQQLGEVMLKINDENSTITKLIQDTSLVTNFSETMQNLNSGSKSLEENMEALKHNILFRGYFNKKRKAEAKASDAEKDEEQRLEQE
jgi:phospholipid/cholesterol/gamma-HCH transport system substrate-binding protein